MEDENEIRAEDLPIYRKGAEILDVVMRIGELIPEDNEHLQFVKGQMISDAAMLTVKVAGAEAGGLYDLKMEAAAIIRIILFLLFCLPA